jgi:FMN phosphatase YigB (HAD superfamily)
LADFILPHAMPGALDARPGTQLLSLDCFDTLLWRDTHAPGDLFGVLPIASLAQRVWSEERARTASMLRRKRFEVSIEEIYAELMPNATTAERDQAVAAELAAEARHCFAFQPTVALMQEAKRRGLGVIIVSDTYLNEAQLRALIAKSAGDDVAGLIDRIFCSSVYGRSKGEGLYELVLKELSVAPGAILHIGDNKAADVGGVAKFGVQTLHLRQFSEATQQRLRLESSVNAMLHPQTPETALTHQPHRPALAAIEPQVSDGAEALGVSAIGPVMYAFDRWVNDEAAVLREARGGRVHKLFLMRDGHLPHLVHQASGASDGHAVEISRFTAVASSFVDETAVERYLQLELGNDLRAVAKQLLLPAHEIAMIFKDLPTGAAAIAGFLKAIRSPQRMRRILKASAGFAERLVAHIRKVVDPAPGDTLMLVDLGYNGSVQNEVEPLLRRALNVHVAGRYLLLREYHYSGYDKRGLIDPTHYDAHTLEAMCSNVAVVEQICTAAQGSVIDYQADGTPIRRESSIKGRQSDVRDRIQAGCLRFAREQRNLVLRTNTADDAMLWRRGAAAALMRLMFMPLPGELSALAEFEHDVNLGVDDKVALFDPAIAKRGLRQRGLFYMKGSDRMYLPAELHGEGLALKLSLLAHKRFGLTLKYADFIDQTISLPVIIADGRDVSTGSVTATPTHDGYYLAPIPVGDCRFSVGLQFGQLYDWVQIESATFMPVEQFLSDKQRPGMHEAAANPSLEGMEQAAPHLFRCADEFSFMMVPPPARTGDQPMMLAVVFRPIAAREAKPATANPLLQTTGATA